MHLYLLTVGALSYSFLFLLAWVVVVDDVFVAQLYILSLCF